jgi:hypothetical protein
VDIFRRLFRFILLYIILLEKKHSASHFRLSRFPFQASSLSIHLHHYRLFIALRASSAVASQPTPWLRLAQSEGGLFTAIGFGLHPSFFLFLEKQKRETKMFLVL